MSISKRKSDEGSINEVYLSYFGQLRELQTTEMDVDKMERSQIENRAMGLVRLWIVAR